MDGRCVGVEVKGVDGGLGGRAGVEGGWVEGEGVGIGCKMGGWDEGEGVGVGVGGEMGGGGVWEKNLVLALDKHSLM